jgi:hypothetical protein
MKTHEVDLPFARAWTVFPVLGHSLIPSHSIRHRILCTCCLDVFHVLESEFAGNKKKYLGSPDCHPPPQSGLAAFGSGANVRHLLFLSYPTMDI